MNFFKKSVNTKFKKNRQNTELCMCTHQPAGETKHPDNWKPPESTPFLFTSLSFMPRGSLHPEFRANYCLTFLYNLATFCRISKHILFSSLV